MPLLTEILAVRLTEALLISMLRTVQAVKQFAILRMVDRVGSPGIDVSGFARAMWPHSKTARPRLNSGAGGVLAVFVRLGLLARFGKGRFALYRLTRSGRSVMSEFERQISAVDDLIA